MQLRLRDHIRQVASPDGSAYFLFNTEEGTWAAIPAQAFQFLQVASRNGKELSAIGHEFGFSNEEIRHFVHTLGDLSLLDDGRPNGKKNGR